MSGAVRLVEVSDQYKQPIEGKGPVAIETSRGLLVAGLRQIGRRDYSIKPMAAARYRERHGVPRMKFDHVDAMTLANILRTDAQAHRPTDELAQASRCCPAQPRTPSEFRAGPFRRQSRRQGPRDTVTSESPAPRRAFDTELTIRTLLSPAARSTAGLRRGVPTVLAFGAGPTYPPLHYKL